MCPSSRNARITRCCGIAARFINNFDLFVSILIGPINVYPEGSSGDLPSATSYAASASGSVVLSANCLSKPEGTALADRFTRFFAIAHPPVRLKPDTTTVTGPAKAGPLRLTAGNQKSRTPAHARVTHGQHLPESIEVQIDDGRCEQREHLADGESADDGDAERPAQF